MFSCDGSPIFLIFRLLAVLFQSGITAFKQLAGRRRKGGWIQGNAFHDLPNSVAVASFIQAIERVSHPFIRLFHVLFLLYADES